MVTVNSGAPEPDDRFEDTPRAKWKLLLNAKRSFLGRRLNYDCRCLVQFCEEAEVVYEELGYCSAEQMIREGYKLEPSQVELAVAWLRYNEPLQAIGIGDVAAAIKAAKEKPLPGHGGDRKTTQDAIESAKASPLGHNRDQRADQGRDSTLKQDRANTYTLRRLARDAPELLDKIEAGEMNVNQAAIAAGIRKKPSNAEKAVAAFRKSENRLEPLRLMVGMLEPYELAVLRDWCIERLD